MKTIILESGTIIKTTRHDNDKIQIDTNKKEDIEKFIGNTPWDIVWVIGYDGNEFINTTLDTYGSIEFLLQYCELNQPEWLNLKAGKGEDFIVVDNCKE